MTDLLPPNASPLERAVDGASARLDELPVPLRDLWSAERCPPAFLPWLAWALGVETWDPDWPEGLKRLAVAEAFQVHREKGTVAAVRRVLRQIGAVYDLVEGPDAARKLSAMQAYVCILNSNTVVLGDIGDIRAALDRAKRASLHLTVEVCAGFAAPTPLPAGFGTLGIIRFGSEGAPA